MQEKKDAWDKFKEGVEVLGIATLVVYTIYTIKMYRANKEAADAAKSAADTAREALVSVQRAFIYFSTAINIQGDVPDPKTMKVGLWEFSVPFENSGDTPTREAMIHFEIYPSKNFQIISHSLTPDRLQGKG